MPRAVQSLVLLVIFSVSLPVAVVLSTHLARRSFERVKLRDQTVTVKGYAERPITADRGTWSADLSVRHEQIAQGYTELEEGRKKLLAYLSRQGFKADAVEMGPVDIRTLYSRDEKGNLTNTIEGYVLNQGFAVSSSEVQRIAGVAREASDLLREGIELDAHQPVYLYTKLDEAKLQMLGEATANARARADALVSHSTTRIGALRSASQGVFQITPAFSTDTSDSGYNDTTSIEKVIKAVVTLEFALVE
jgi:hypothetical protein